MVEQEIRRIPLDAIAISEMNVRHGGAQADLAELAESIVEFGLLQPVVLWGEFEGDYPKSQPKYQLIIGQRRFNAYAEVLAKKDPQRWKAIPAIFTGKISATEAKIRSLAENLHRMELNHADAAEAVTALYRHFGKDMRRLSRETGFSVTRINRYLKIKERASKEAMELLRAKKVRDFDVKRVVDWADDDRQRADRMVRVMARLPTAREKRNLMEYARENPKARSASEDELEREAKKPRIRRKISVDLTDALWQGLESAEHAMAMEREEIAALAIEKWLRDQGFLK